MQEINHFMKTTLINATISYVISETVSKSILWIKCECPLLKTGIRSHIIHRSSKPTSFVKESSFLFLSLFLLHYFFLSILLSLYFLNPFLLLCFFLCIQADSLAAATRTFSDLFLLFLREVSGDRSVSVKVNPASNSWRKCWEGRLRVVGSRVCSGQWHGCLSNILYISLSFDCVK